MTSVVRPCCVRPQSTGLAPSRRRRRSERPFGLPEPLPTSASGYGLNEIDASNYEETPMICEAVRPRLPWGTKKTPGVTGRVRKTEGRVEGLSVGPTFLLLTDAC